MELKNPIRKVLMKRKRKSISSDLKKVDKITETNIDYSDIPPLDESFFKKKISDNSDNNMKFKSRYSTVGLAEGEFEPGSHHQVLKNLLSIKKKSDMDIAETKAYDQAITQAM